MIYGLYFILQLIQTFDFDNRFDNFDKRIDITFIFEELKFLSFFTVHAQ